MKIFIKTSIIFSSVLFSSCAENLIKPKYSSEVLLKYPSDSTLSSKNYNRELAKAIYVKACYKCHDLYKPTDYTDEQWIPIIKAMAPKTNLDAAETALVLKYLVSEN